jgi:hypothetical protein
MYRCQWRTSGPRSWVEAPCTVVNLVMWTLTCMFVQLSLLIHVFAACLYLWSHPCPSQSSLKSAVHCLSLITQSPTVQSSYNSPSCNYCGQDSRLKRWGRSRPSCPGMIRIYPESHAASSFESSLLGGRTPGRRPYCKKCVTPQRVQRSTGVIERETARGYVLVPSGTFNLII